MFQSVNFKCDKSLGNERICDFSINMNIWEHCDNVLKEKNKAYFRPHLDSVTQFCAGWKRRASRWFKEMESG